MSKKKRKKKAQRPKPPRRVYQTPRSKIRPITRKREDILARAREMPILGCWRTKHWQESGMTSILLVREQDPLHILYAAYLVDLLCLGVKDVMVEVSVPKSSLRGIIRRLFKGDEEPCDAAFAHQLIYGALEYARKYGLEPHPDFTRLEADQILDPPGTHTTPQYKIHFGGEDGKPVFVVGPYDDEAFVRQVLETLERTAPGEYHYVLPFSPADAEEWLKFEEDEEF